jgi:ATP-dependent DNA helicase RecQ
VLSGGRRLSLRRVSARAKSSKRRSRIAAGTARVLLADAAENEAVFQALRTWRGELAREHSVPAYTVFHDSTLHEIATVLPASLDQLRGISGIGATKLERYGPALLDIVRAARPDSGVPASELHPAPSPL